MAGQTDPHISLFSPQEVLLFLFVCNYCLDRLILTFHTQVEFMAEDEMVEIVPNMNMDPLNFIAVIIIIIIISPQLFKNL